MPCSLPASQPADPSAGLDTVLACWYSHSDLVWRGRVRLDCAEMPSV